MATTEPTDTLDAEPTSTTTTDTGLDANVLAALSYVLGPLTGLVVYLVEPEDDYVRFHAAQSITTFGLLFVASIVFSVVQTVLFTVLFVDPATFIVGSLVSLALGLVSLVVGLGALVLWVYLVVSAYKGRTPRIPVAAGLADRLV